MRPLFGRSYVRVRFPGTNLRGERGRLYVYYCPGAKIGDRIIVPPNIMNWEPQTVRVVAYGRRGYWSDIREAVLAPPIHPRTDLRKAHPAPPDPDVSRLNIVRGTP